MVITKKQYLLVGFLGLLVGSLGPVNEYIWDFIGWIFTALFAGIFAGWFAKEFTKKYEKEKIDDEFIKAIKEETLNSYFSSLKAYNILNSINDISSLPSIDIYKIKEKNISFFQNIILLENNLNTSFSNNIDKYDLLKNILDLESRINNVNSFTVQGAINVNQVELIRKNLKYVVFHEIYNIKLFNNIIKHYLNTELNILPDDIENSGVMKIYNYHKNLINIKNNIDKKIVIAMHDKQSIELNEKLISQIVKEELKPYPELYDNETNIIDEIIHRIKIVNCKK